MDTNTYQVRAHDELRVQAALLRTPEFMAQFDPEKFARQLERIASTLAFAPPSVPVGVEAVRGAWLAAITLANNICVQESDRENDRDGDTAWIDGTAKCAKRIREYAHPTDAELLEMLDEAGANAAKAALVQQPAAVDEAMVERIAALLHEEATGEPWIVAGVEHPGPDRDYYRGLARKVAALATQQPGGSDNDRA